MRYNSILKDESRKKNERWHIESDDDQCQLTLLYLINSQESQVQVTVSLYINIYEEDEEDK